MDTDSSVDALEDQRRLMTLQKRIEVQVEEESADDQRTHVKSTHSIPTLSYLGSETDFMYDNFVCDFGGPSGPAKIRKQEVSARVKPFHLKWSFGVTPKPGLLNITTNNSKRIFFVANNSGVAYEYENREMQFLEGHRNFIKTISCDGTGKWLVTADDGEDSCVIIWDMDDNSVAYTLFNIYPKGSVIYVAISPCAKYLITIGHNSYEEQFSIDFWMWTLGEEKPHDTFKVAYADYGMPKKIAFNPSQVEHVMLIFEKQVILLNWDLENAKIQSLSTPVISKINKIGPLTSGTYQENCHACYASSSKGCILIFGNTLYAKDFAEGELNNNKMFINAIKISDESVNCITAVDGVLVAGDAKGQIYFFDNRVRILYWHQEFELGPILSIQFHVHPRKYKFGKADNPNITLIDDMSNLHQKLDETQILYKENVPSDASLQRRPFVVRDFFILTSDCNIYQIDFLGKKCTSLFHIADSDVSAITTHGELPYLVIGFTNGRLILYHYEERKKLTEAMLPKTEEYEVENAICCLEYSLQSLHLVCGTVNGEIWILENILLVPKIDVPIRYTKSKIMKIVFSFNSMQFAFYDSNMTVFLMMYDPETDKWNYKGKVRSHYKEIRDMLFYPAMDKTSLFTVGSDRYLIEYSAVTDAPRSRFEIILRERIDQSAIPTCFIYHLKKARNKYLGYFLVADDQYKLKLLNDVTMITRRVVLGPAYGCFKNQPILKMRIVPFSESRYLVFMTKNHIGLHLLPADGNPFKYLGYQGHPKELTDFVLSHDGQYIFTFGSKDRCVLMWNIRTRAVEISRVLGGEEFEPFYCLVDGGRNGWMFHEIQDLFFYMQILHQGESNVLPRRVNDTIPVTELPDLVRACGFYPSEFEIENMMIDIKYRDYDEDDTIGDQISFYEFFKLFLNHKPAYGYSIQKLESAFDVITQIPEFPEPDYINTEEFLDTLTFSGEPINVSNLHKCLTTLMRVEEKGDAIYDFLPSEIYFETLKDDILGIDMNRHQVDDDGPKSEDNSTTDFSVRH